MTIAAPNPYCWNGVKTDETARYFQGEESGFARLADRLAAGGGEGVVEVLGFAFGDGAAGGD